MNDKTKSYWHKLFWNEIEDDEFQFWLEQMHQRKLTPAKGWLGRHLIYLVIILLLQLMAFFISFSDSHKAGEDSLAGIVFVGTFATIILIETTFRTRYFFAWLRNLSEDERQTYLSILKRKWIRAFQLFIYSLVGTAIFCLILYIIYLLLPKSLFQN